MRKLRLGLLTLAIVGALGAVAGVALLARPAHGGDGQGPPVSPDTRQILNDISADRIQSTIHTLVGFGTRHTLSSQTDLNRGIGAATNWVYDQLQQDAAASDGRMTVEKETFTQPPGPRIPEPTQITNVIATLHGTQPESQGRMYVISGHLDSRVSNVLNGTSDAPG